MDKNYKTVLSELSKNAAGKFSLKRQFLTLPAATFFTSNEVRTTVYRAVPEPTRMLTLQKLQACHEHVRNLNLITKCKCAILKDHEAEMEKKSRGT